EIWRRVAGHMYERDTFTCKVGDSVGKTKPKRGAPHDFRTHLVMVDIDDKYMYRAPGANGNVTQTTAVVCADPTNPDVLKQFVLAQDADDAKRKELRGESDTRGTKKGSRG